MDLVFRHAGVLRQAEDYIQLRTHDPSRPFVFKTPDETEIFVCCVDEIGVCTVRALTPSDWAKLRKLVREDTTSNSTDTMPRAKRAKHAGARSRSKLRTVQLAG